MSMPQSIETFAEQLAVPRLRLADDAAPEPVARPAAVEEPKAYRDGDRVTADDRATLPASCVRCGDTMGLLWLPTLRGAVRFAICREHAIASAAMAVVGLGVGLVGVYVAASGGDSRRSSLLVGTCLVVIFAGLVTLAVPVWTWRRKGERRRLLRVCREAREAIRG